MPEPTITSSSPSAWKSCWRAFARPCDAPLRRSLSHRIFRTTWKLISNGGNRWYRAARCGSTPKEFDLLRHLVASQGKPLEHRRLLQAVWGPDYGDETEYLRVFINQLRKKIEPDPAHPKYIHTDPWVGYRFEPASPATSKPKKNK